MDRYSLGVTVAGLACRGGIEQNQCSLEPPGGAMTICNLQEPVDGLDRWARNGIATHLRPAGCCEQRPEARHDPLGYDEATATRPGRAVRKDIAHPECLIISLDRSTVTQEAEEHSRDPLAARLRR
jgi:hypothetical protein